MPPLSIPHSGGSTSANASPGAPEALRAYLADREVLTTRFSWMAPHSARHRAISRESISRQTIVKAPPDSVKMLVGTSIRGVVRECHSETQTPFRHPRSGAQVQSLQRRLGHPLGLQWTCRTCHRFITGQFLMDVHEKRMAQEEVDSEVVASTRAKRVEIIGTRNGYAICDQSAKATQV